MTTSREKIDELVELAKRRRSDYPDMQDSQIISRVVLGDAEIPYMEKSEVGTRLNEKLKKLDLQDSQTPSKNPRFPKQEKQA